MKCCCLWCSGWGMPIVFVLAPVGGPTSVRSWEASRNVGGAPVCGPIGEEGQLWRWEGPRRQRHPDRRSQSVVYISEQMAFIYILERWNSSLSLVSGSVHRWSFVNGCDYKLKSGQKSPTNICTGSKCCSIKINWLGNFICVSCDWFPFFKSLLLIVKIFNFSTSGFLR